MIPAHDVARVRLDNAMLLFDEFVQATIKSPDAATLRGLERRFAERLQIQPSYWSQIKSRSRQIGERLARQFEQLCRKPVGWMDLPQGPAAAQARLAGSGPRPGLDLAVPGQAAGPGQQAVGATSQPQDDDERFIVSLVLSYYRRHPQRARTRLLDLLGEVLTPPATESAAPAAASAAPPAPARKLAPGVTRPAARPALPKPDDDLALWARTRAAIAPLKGKAKR